MLSSELSVDQMIVLHVVSVRGEGDVLLSAMSSVGRDFYHDSGG